MEDTRTLAQRRKDLKATIKALDQLRARELATMTNAEAFQHIDALNFEGELWSNPTEWSGLVEQQALFHRRKKA